MLFVPKVDAKRASFRALARDSTGGKVLPLLCFAILIGRPLGRRVARAPGGPIGVRRQQGAFHHVRTISPAAKTTAKSLGS